MSAIVGLGRRTISGLLCASAQQFMDWSSAYRLFDKERFERSGIFSPIRQNVVERLKENDPLVVMMDDTLIRKRGRKIHGTAWKRDPLGPHFSTNFVWGQRFLQVSAALPDGSCFGRAKAVPIELIHAPSATKPKKKASPEEWIEYRKQQEITKVSAVGAVQLHELRNNLDADAKGKGRKIIAAVDGGFTNKTVFRDLPENTTVIGRIRKDAKLYAPPDETLPSRRGRRRWYGVPLSTPEQIRQDESFPWAQVEAYAAGKRHVFDVKSMPAVRWVGSGDRDVSIIIVRPLAYRPRKGAKLLYRNPAYLICTDPYLPIEELLQAYLWRWEIELNFRDEKTLLGVGEAQVRKATSVEAVPSLIVASYSMLLLAGSTAQSQATILPRPIWQHQKTAERCTTPQLISQFRSQLWKKAMGINLTHFVRNAATNTKPVFLENSLSAAVCYASK